MASTVVLRIDTQGDAEALRILTQLDAAADRLRQPINMPINTGGNTLQQIRNVNTGLTRTSGLLSRIGGAIQNYAISAVIEGTVRATKEALSTMREVDSELTNIQKVTNATAAEIEALGDRAYDTASKYGVAANEYLQSVGVFAKAGYGDAAEQLGELAIKTQLVGDVSADVASKFLLSADAAFDFEGNVTALSSVLDKANTIENNYATSIEKLAAGFPIVASTASMANLSIDQLMAALGTITSVTQETGTKAATALRALILNIMGAVGTEIEDGVSVTTESVQSLDALLLKFAPDAVAAAEATGSIINPMEALYSLAKAAEEGLMTEAELADFLSSLGGKLRTNQLSALIENWGMYEEMLRMVESSAGSADQEVETMLGSWDAKVNILKNSWTELVNTIADTDLIKGTFDFLTDIIDGIQESIDPKDYDKWQERYGFMAMTPGGITMDEATLNDYSIALERVNEKYAKGKLSAEEYRDELSDIEDKYAKTASTLKGFEEDNETLSESQYKLVDSFDALKTALASGGDEMQTFGVALAAQFMAMGYSAEEASGMAASALNELYGSEEEVNEADPTVTVKEEGAAETIAVLGAVDAAAAPVTKVVTVSYQGYWGQEIPIGEFASGTDSAPGGPALVNEVGPELISAPGGYAYIAGGGEPTVTNLARGSVVLTASQTRRALNGLRSFGVIPAYKGGTTKLPKSSDILAALNGVEALKIGPGSKPTYAPEASIYDVLGVVNPFGTTATPKKPDNDTPTYYDYGGGPSGPLPPNFTQLEDELDKALKNLDAQAELALNEGNILGAIKIYGEAQSLISELLQKYLDNGYASDSDEVLRLANMGYDYAGKQLGENEELIDELVDALNKLEKSVDEANAIEEKRLEVEEARESLAEAQAALANAQKQRTVRIFNPVTGQWEWVADSASLQRAQEQVAKAEETLAEREKSLEEEKFEQEFEALISALENSGAEDIAGLSISPALLNMISGGSEADQMAIFRALQAVTGSASHLASTEGQTQFNHSSNTDQSTTIVIGDLKLGEVDKNMTLGDLTDLLRGLGLT